MCGCRGNKNPRPVVRNTSPNVVNNAVNRRIIAANNIRANTTEQTNQQTPNVVRPSGMTKEQRDVERKKRIQLILKMKNQ